jgi:hypothetical protein
MLQLEYLEDRNLPTLLVPGAPPVPLTALDALPPGAIVSNGGMASSISFTGIDPATGHTALTATLYSAVYKEDATGFLDFLFQIQSSKLNSLDAVWNPISTNFSQAASFLDADYLRSLATVPNGFLQATGSLTHPSSASLSADGTTVTFNFSNALGPGSVSTIFLLETHVTGFSTTGATKIVTYESTSILPTFSPTSGSTGGGSGGGSSGSGGGGGGSTTQIAAASSPAANIVPVFPAAPTAITLPLVSKLELISTNMTSMRTGRVSADAGFVNGLYQNLLNRTPGTPEITFWVQMMLGGVSAQQVATDIWQSPEHRQVEVTQYYASFLGRAPDAAGEAMWVNDFLGGASEVDVALGFLTSAEYQAAHSTDLAYVDALYAQVLGRQADAAGEASWLQALQNGASRGAVALAFLTSAEADSLVVIDYYNQFLNRNPSPAEVQGWVNRLVSNQATLESVGEAFLASAEYFARFGGV